MASGFRSIWEKPGGKSICSIKQNNPETTGTRGEPLFFGKARKGIKHALLSASFVDNMHPDDGFVALLASGAPASADGSR